MNNHYKYLEYYLPILFGELGIEYSARIISAHGDKFYGYREKFNEAGLTFNQGAAIGMLTYVHPYCNECRQTENGWIAPCDWIINNKNRFLKYLP